MTRLERIYLVVRAARNQARLSLPLPEPIPWGASWP